MMKTKDVVSRKNVVRIIQSLAVCLTVFAFTNCTRPVWKTHIKNVETWLEDCKGDAQELKIKDYAHKGNIQSEKDKAKVVNAMLADSAPAISQHPELVITNTIVTDNDTTIWEESYPRFEICSIRELQNAGKLTADSIAALKENLLKDINIGADVIEVKWSYKGKEFSSLEVFVNEDKHINLVTYNLQKGRNTTVKGQKPTE